MSICEVTDAHVHDDHDHDAVADAVADAVGDAVADAVADAVGEFERLRGFRRDVAYMTVEREIRRLQAVQAAMVSLVKSSLSYSDDGHHSPTRWVQAVTNCSRGTASRVAHTAAMLAELPVFAAAVTAGEIGADQIRVMLGLHTNTRCRRFLVESDAMMTKHATELTLADFVVVCQRFNAHTDPDGTHRDHEVSRQNRSVTTTRIGAGHQFHAHGDALSGEIITKILDAYTKAEFDIDVADANATYANQPGRKPLARTNQQRRYDAMLTIFLNANHHSGTTHTAGAGTVGSGPGAGPGTGTGAGPAGAGPAGSGTRASGTPSAGSRVPLINIITNEHTLTTAITNYYSHQPDQAAGSPTTGSPTPGSPATGTPVGMPFTSDRLWLCQTTGGTPVDPTDLLVAALIGHIRRVVVDSTGRVIDLGRRSRLFTGAAREAVLLTDTQCCWPGCIHPITQIDHQTPWAKAGGTTTPLNGAPLCPQHNRHKHNQHTTTTRTPTGWHHHRQNGTEIAPRTNNPP